MGKKIHQIPTTGTVADLNNSTYIAVDSSANGTKKLPANLLATKSVQDNLSGSIAPLFSESKSYAVGDPVMDTDGKLYRCTVAHSAGAWNSDHFTLDTATHRIKDLATTKYTGFMALDDANGTGKFPIDNLIGCIAEIYYPETTGGHTATNAVAGMLYMYQGKCYLCKENTSGVWDNSKFTESKVSNNFIKLNVPYSSLSVTANGYINSNNGNAGSDSSYKILTMPAEFKTIKINPNFSELGKGWRFLDKDGVVISYGEFSYPEGTTYSINNPSFRAYTFEFTQGVSSEAPVIVIYSNAGDINDAIGRKVNTSDFNVFADKIIDKYVPYSSLTITSNSYVNGENGNLGSDSSSKRISMPAEFKTIKINPNFSDSSKGWRFVDGNGNVLSCGKFSNAVGTTYSINNPAFKAVVFEFTQGVSSEAPVIVIYSNAGDINNTLSRKVNGYELYNLSEKVDGKIDYHVPYSSLIVTASSYINGNNGNITDGPSAVDYKRLSMPVNFAKVKLNPNFYHSSLGWRIGDAEGNTLSCGKFTESAGTTYTITNSNSKAYVFEFTQSNGSDYPIISLYEDSSDINKSLALKENKKDDFNPLARVGESPSYISIFKKIVHIGDSLTRGQTDTTSPNSNGADIPDYSRPVIMGKMIGNENLNLGLGGRTASEQYLSSDNRTAGWYTNATEPGYTINFTPDAFLENPGDCYIIALGTNDVESGGFTGSVSTDIDDENLNNNANTSVGGYAKIIQKIQEMQPKAKIFCVTIPKTRNTNKVALRAEANEKIAEIVEHFDNCYLIDLFTYAEQSTDDIFATYYKNRTHNNALGYMLRSQQYIAYIDWIISHNLADFRNIAFIGTNYDFVP